MVSEGDLLKPFDAEQERKRAWWLNVVAEGTDLAPEFLEYVRLDQRTAADPMVAPVVTASETSTVTELAEQMTRHHIKRLPILRGGKMVGIVSRADLVRALANMPNEVLEAT